MTMELFLPTFNNSIVFSRPSTFSCIPTSRKRKKGLRRGNKVKVSLDGWSVGPVRKIFGATNYDQKCTLIDFSSF